MLVNIIYAVVMVALGVFIIAHPETLIALILRILGICSLAVGIYTLIYYFTKGKALGETPLNIMIGGVMSIAGLIFLFRPLKLTTIVFLVIGIVLICKGIFGMRVAWEAHVAGFSRWNGMMISAVITALLGIIMIANPLIAPSIIFYVMGVLIIFEGVSTLVSFFLCREYCRDDYNDVDSN
jgi:uncharacterized membrane protein HdeD (DUF308 family)